MSRGRDSDSDDRDAQVNVRDQENCILWFGCQTGDSVDANSTIAVELFNEFRNHANRSDGKLVLPRDMQNTRIGVKGEITTTSPPNILL